ncbi:MAG: DUF2088 domain-containing protein [Peptococcaceae bacterium]|nr:DUF2088 domain-containing protein [Peptococcaceae bacterium]
MFPNNIHLPATTSGGLSTAAIEAALLEYFKAFDRPGRVLIVPPDISRSSSYAGPIVNMLWRQFPKAEVDIMPALGTHTPMTAAEIKKMYGDLPLDRFLVHDWRQDAVNVGEVAASYVASLSGGLMQNSIAVDVNKRVIDPRYDLVISVGQVVPHEVAGFANYTKNIVVGCGGSSMINQSHYLGALYGMERIMGRADNPVRRLYNYAANQFLPNAPIIYVLTVTTVDEAGLNVQALAIGTGDELFAEMAKVSAAQNITFLDEPLPKVVVYLDPDKFKTTWVGNKAVYRTRMAIADGGELIVIAPALAGCGEDQENDRLIKKFGYLAQQNVLAAVSEDAELANNLSVAAHLIHGSSEGRFKITYAPGRMSPDMVRSLKYDYLPMDIALKKYDWSNLREGLNLVNGEEIFYISNPAIGLWATRSKFNN